MIYHLHCVVNAIGTPQEDTFSTSADKAWRRHLWNNVPKRGEHVNSATMADMDECESSLKARGDRVVECTVKTNEDVRFQANA